MSAVAAPADAPSLAQQLERLKTLPYLELGSEAWPLFQAMETSAEVKAALAWADQQPDAPVIGPVRQMAIRRWAEFDGPAAFANARTHSSAARISLENAALAGWASSDPEAAWMALMQVSNQGADTRYNVVQVLLHIADRDLRRALLLFEDLAPNRFCLECHAGTLALVAMHKGQLEEIRAALARMVNGPARDALRLNYWHTLAQFRPEAAVQELEGLKGSSDYAQARISLCRGWARKDFDACLAYVLEHDGEVRQELLQAAVQSWASGAVAEDVAAVLKKLPSPMDERALLGVASSLARINPASTIKWIEGQANSPIRVESLDRAMTRWASNDGDAARAYLTDCEDTDTRGYLLWSYLLARTSNHTLTLSDLELIDERFNPDWVTQLLERIALRLVDPSVNQQQFFDVGVFQTFVQSHPRLSEDQKTKALTPLRRESNKKQP